MTVAESLFGFCFAAGCQRKGSNGHVLLAFRPEAASNIRPGRHKSVLGVEVAQGHCASALQDLGRVAFMDENVVMIGRILAIFFKHLRQMHQRATPR